MPTTKAQPAYEVNYMTLPIAATIVEDLYPYIVAEAKRRRVSVDTVASDILNENLARKRIQSRSHANKKMKLSAKTTSSLKRK